MIYAHEIREKKERYTGPRPSFPRAKPELAYLFNKYLLWRHLDPDLATGNGWYPAMYKGAPRIIIPCSNSDGVPYFQGRAMSDDVELRYASPAATRDDSIVIVWPYDLMPRRGGVIVEGPMDALAAAGLDYVGVALMGNQPTDEVIEHLARFARAFQPIFIVPDADALELGPNVLCGLAQRGIGATVLAPRRKDLAAMSPIERNRFLHVQD